MQLVPNTTTDGRDVFVFDPTSGEMYQIFIHEEIVEGNGGFQFFGYRARHLIGT